jgi:protocatechuate 3,4-dioxygenase beta subunit
MSRAVHRGAGWYKFISAFLVLAFAFSVTAVAVSVSGQGLDGTAVASAKGGNNGNGNAFGHDKRPGTPPGLSDPAEPVVPPAECDCDCGCGECDDDEPCPVCEPSEPAPETETPSPEPEGSADPAPKRGQGEAAEQGAEPAPESGPTAAATTDDAPDAKGEPDVASSAVSAELPLTLETGTYDPPASDAGVTPAIVDGNPACPVGTTTFKIDQTPANGVYDLPGGGTITISGATDYRFDFDSTGVSIKQVIVKASSFAHVYDYSPDGVTADGNLVSTVKPDGGFYQISHVSFCYTEVESYEISGYKWEDTNGDGLWYNGVEPLLSGWTIQLFHKVDGEWELFGETTTGSGGRYEFKDLPAGTYMVQEVQQAGYIQTYGGCEFTLGADAALPLVAECHNEEPGCFDFGNMPVEEELYKKTFGLTAAGLDARFAEVSYYVTFMRDGAPVTLSLSESAPHTAQLNDLPSGTTISNVRWWAKVDGVDYLLGLGAVEETIEESDLTNEFDYDSRVHGYKFEDIDGDGSWAAEGESALPNWTVRLYMRVDGDWVMVDETDTDFEGHYEFTGLLPGDYYVVEVQQDGYEQTAGPTGASDAFTVGDGTDRREDFGNWPEVEARIDGYKFEDIDGDGGWDLLDSERGLEGWTIRLFRYEGDALVLVAETMTDSSGHYFFEGLGVGDYYVDEVQQDGFAQTSGGYDFSVLRDGSVVRLAGPPVPVTLESATSEVPEIPLATFDFGNHPLTISLYGYKYFDLDGDGHWSGDGEIGLDGWTIELYEKLDDVWTLVATTDTGAGGFYEFTGLEPGEYYVVEIIPEDMDVDWYQTDGPTGQSDAFALDWGDERRVDFGNTHDYVKTWELTLTSDHESPAGVSYYVTYDLDGVPTRTDLVHETGTFDPMVYSMQTAVAYGDSISDVEWWASWEGEEIKLGDGVVVETVEGDLTNSFALEPIVFGHKFSDDDADGVWDDGEETLEGWEIVLVRKMADGSEKEYERAVTDADGYYEFRAVLPGEYYVMEVQQSGWMQTAGPAGTFTVENPDEEGPFDFGNAELGRIYGFKYADFAPTGVLGEEDSPLGSWTIQLFQMTDEGWEQLAETVTADDGFFSFEGLLPGDYYVVEVQQDGWTQTSGPVGPGDVVSLVPGGEIGPVDFLNTPPFEPLSPVIFGHKYDDADGDGTHDAGEAGLEGWTIELHYLEGGEWTLLASTTTDADGYYEFRALEDGSPLPDGEYYVVEVQRPGWEQTFGPTGPDDSFTVDDEIQIDYGPYDFGNNGGLPFLPFTGGSFGLIAGLALLAMLAGGLLKRLGGATQG